MGSGKSLFSIPFFQFPACGDEFTPNLSSRGLKARGDPLGSSKRRDKPVRVPRDTMDYHIGHLPSPLAMTSVVLLY